MIPHSVTVIFTRYLPHTIGSSAKIFHTDKSFKQFLTQSRIWWKCIAV